THKQVSMPPAARSAGGGPSGDHDARLREDDPKRPPAQPGPRSARRMESGCAASALATRATRGGVSCCGLTGLGRMGLGGAWKGIVGPGWAGSSGLRRGGPTRRYQDRTDRTDGAEADSALERQPRIQRLEVARVLRIVGAVAGRVRRHPSLALDL